MAKDAHIPELVDDGAFAQAADKINLSPEHRSDAISALDALAAEHLKPEGQETPPPAPKDDTVPPGAEDTDLNTPPADEKAAAEKAAADKAAADKKAADEKAAVEKKAGDSQPEIKAKDGKPAAGEQPKDDFDKIQLPPHARPKSGEAFDQIKTMAREKITGLTTQVTELSTRAEAAEARVKELESAQNTLSPEIQSELEDLRKFKLSHDVESDPTFTQFNTDLNKNNESIFAKLKSAGISDENLTKIKEIGLDNLEWEPILSKMNIQTRRYIEAKLVENVTLAEKRDESLAKARENATEFLRERSGREAKELIAAANEWTTKLPWTAQQQVPANATPEQKQAIEASNAFARTQMTNLQAWLQAKSPKQIAELAVGTMIAYKNKADLEALQARHTALEASSKASLEEVTKERDALKAELESIKSRGVPKTLGVPPVTTKTTHEVKPGAVDIRSGEQAMEAYEQEFKKAQAASAI